VLNGTHNVLELDVVDPSMKVKSSSNRMEAVEDYLKRSDVGDSLHDLGVIHGDLHSSKIAFSLPELSGKPKAVFIKYLNSLERRTPLVLAKRIVDLKSMAFSQGGHLTSNKKSSCLMAH